MANRNSLKEAQELKESLQTGYPNVELRITDASEVRRMWRQAAREAGFEIVEDNGGNLVTVNTTQFKVLEVRHCNRCNAEILTAAIGELSGSECPTCKGIRQSQQATDSQRRARASRTRVKEAAWRDGWEER